MEQYLHYKIYKPYGMLSQMLSHDPKEARKKAFLPELFDFPEGLMPVGRLDEKSEGLLLLTTDGKLSDQINRSGLEKEYYVQLDGDIPEVALRELELGVTIGFGGAKYRTRAVKVCKLDSDPPFAAPHQKMRIGRHRPYSWISITLQEGKFRQVRKMTAAVGYPTLRLVRIRVGRLTLEGLDPGEVWSVPDLKEALGPFPGKGDEPDGQ